MSEFTVKVAPHILTRVVFGDDGQPKSEPRTVYDISVVDGQGEGAEEFLVGSRQGYENRKDAVGLAVRLFGSPRVVAEHVGVDPPELRDPEAATLIVYEADGAVAHKQALR